MSSATAACDSSRGTAGGRGMRQPPWQLSRDSPRDNSRDSRRDSRRPVWEGGMRRWEASWGQCMGATDSGRAVFAGGGDGVNEAMAAAWLRPAQRERGEAGARGTGIMTVGETDGRRSGLSS
jgi:hypothetical protein